MKTFGTLDANDYTVEDFYSTAPMSWELVSSSHGVTITSPEYLLGAITIQRATNEGNNFFDYEIDSPINEDTGIYEYIWYRSIKHLFYDRGNFFSGSRFYINPIVTISQSFDPDNGIMRATKLKTNAVNPPDNFYVLSVGQNFYGDEIAPGSFELAIEGVEETVRDDYRGNLFVSESGVGNYVGNIFYDKGVAVIAHNTSSLIGDIGAAGIKIVGGTTLDLDYSSQLKVTRHEINVRLLPQEFNFSPFNPSIRKQYSGSSAALDNIPSSSVSQSYWDIYKLIGDVIKPYVTTIGLYNDKYELLAVAKVATPIQRTFDLEQIFIVRFDT